MAWILPFVLLGSCDKKLVEYEKGSVEIVVERGDAWLHDFPLFLGIKRKNPPQIAVWIEDAQGRYLSTVYASSKIATQSWLAAGGNRRSFTPYAGCAAGYAFAPRRDANGGLLLNPELGVQYALRCGVHLFFAAGYELQRLERLRKYEGRWFSAEFAEQLSHGTLLLKVGVLF